MKKGIILVSVLMMIGTITACGEEPKEKVEAIIEPIEKEESVLAEPETNEEVISTEQETTKEEIDSSSVEEQINTIVTNADLWLMEEEFANDVYNYAVTDLNQNGRLEIISSNMGGTGYYTYSDYYEVNENFDGLVQYHKTTKEGDSEADISEESIPVYFDSETDTYYYVFNDYIKNGAAEYYENKRAISLENGIVVETPIAFKTTIYEGETPTITCEDFSHNEITEEAYETLPDEFFSHYEKKTATIGWCQYSSPSEFKSIGTKEMINTLIQSYAENKFL